MKKWIKSNLLGLIITVCLITSIFFIVLINIIHHDAISLDFDSASIIGTAKEMYSQRKLFLSNWSYQSTMLIDSPAIFTALLLSVINNSLLAQGIANVLCVTILLFLVYKIGKEINLKFSSTILICALFVLPWGCEYLGYQYCMTLDTAAYIIRVSLQLLIIYCYLLMGKEDKRNNINILLGAISLLGVVISTISSGLHTYLVMCVPVLISEFFDVIMKETNQISFDFLKKHLYIILLTIAAIIGIIIKNVLGYNAWGGQEYITLMELFDNVNNTFLALGYLLHILPDGSVNILSCNGLLYLLRFAFFVLIVFSIVSLFKNVKIEKKSKEKKYAILLISIIAVNIFVLCLTKTNYGGIFYEYRYHIFTLVPCFISLGIFFDTIAEKAKTNCILRGVVFLLLLSLCTLNVSYYSNLKKRHNSIVEISEIVKTYDDIDVDTVVVYDDYTLARALNAVDIKHKYVDLRKDFEVSVWGTNYDGYEHEYLGNNVVFITGNDVKLMDYFGKMELISSVTDRKIYLIQNQKLDFMSIFPFSKTIIPKILLQITGNSHINTTTDYPYTKGMILAEGLGVNEDGILSSYNHFGEIIRNPSQQMSKGKYKVSIYGDVKPFSDIHYIIRNNDGCVLFEEELSEGETNTFCFEMDKTQETNYSIICNKGNIDLKSITIMAID